ncbi:hypothetical protein HPP92_009995 [Vanilla planifolia]|uniref:Uncharacterized protein n=1 Tax=Vanilla planifolia TaxID=51239 RepID=A0A835QZK0_VANPL|nr:hypothetical protein HPP92_010137 [Vanilla planifolia]KAG0481911.1 hypothetical protein HPP92_009995 [Vanilla planifolia]
MKRGLVNEEFEMKHFKACGPRKGAVCLLRRSIHGMYCGEGGSRRALRFAKAKSSGEGYSNVLSTDLRKIYSFTRRRATSLMIMATFS